MRASLRLLFLLFTGCLPGVSTTMAATFEWEDKPEGDHVAAFKLYLPDDVQAVRAVIILVPGLDGDGRGITDDEGWRQMAQRSKSALLGCYMKGNQGGSYYEAERWSGKALLQGLKKLAVESKHPELDSVPIASWGHSAGGQFNFNFACWKPERMLAFMVNKGGYYGGQITPSVRKVPALFILGETDTELRVKAITDRYNEGRKHGALWALTVEPGIGHDTGRSQELGIVFIEDVMKLRFDSMGKLQPADPKAGWLGDLTTHAVEKNTGLDAGDKNKVWLPGEATAQLWSQITGGVQPVQAPQ